MLILARKKGQGFRVGDVLVKVVQCNPKTGEVKIGIEAPRSIPIERDDMVKRPERPNPS